VNFFKYSASSNNQTFTSLSIQLMFYKASLQYFPWKSLQGKEKIKKNSWHSFQSSFQLRIMKCTLSSEPILCNFFSFLFAILYIWCMFLLNFHHHNSRVIMNFSYSFNKCIWCFWSSVIIISKINFLGNSILNV
jgi:hypothetical protein